MNDKIDTDALFSQLDDIKKDQIKLLQQHLEYERPLDLEQGWTNLAEAKAAQQVFKHNGELMAKKEQQMSELMSKMQKLADKTYACPDCHAMMRTYLSPVRGRVEKWL